MRSGRPERLAVVLLLVGFSALAAAIWYFGLPWIGLLLPLSFAIAVISER